MSVRFLHTGDWPLGMTRHFFSEGVQERFAQSRFDAIRELGRLAEEEGCRFMVVCGDVFESNLVDRKTVSRALEALKDVPLPELPVEEPHLAEVPQALQGVVAQAKGYVESLVLPRDVVVTDGI